MAQKKTSPKKQPASAVPDQTQKPLQSIVVNLKDFSAFEQQPEDAPFVTFETVQQLFANVTESNYIQRFCSEVGALVQKAPSENILMMNDDEDDDDDAEETEVGNDSSAFLSSWEPITGCRGIPG